MTEVTARTEQEDVQPWREQAARVRATLNDLGQWIADQQAMPDDGWKPVRDEAQATLDALTTQMEELEQERDHWKWDHQEASKELVARAEAAEQENERLRSNLSDVAYGLTNQPEITREQIAQAALAARTEDSDE